MKLKDWSFVNLLLYVDDMLMVSKSKVEIKELKVQLNKKKKLDERS